jgi:hypothetical protein
MFGNLTYIYVLPFLLLLAHRVTLPPMEVCFVKPIGDKKRCMVSKRTKGRR